MAERQDFQKFLEIQVILGRNLNLDLLSPVLLYEHSLAPPPPQRKNKGEISHGIFDQPGSDLQFTVHNTVTTGKDVLPRDLRK